MSHNSSRKEDIRGQLSDIQKKLFGANKSRPDSSHIAGQNADVSGASAASNGPKVLQPQNIIPPPSGSAMLRRNATPPQTALAAHKSGKVIPQANPQLRPESKGQDMNFVVGLSENLLSECRRLTAENHNIRSRMKSQQEEIADYKAQVAALSSTRTFSSSNESNLRDKNWELETSVSALSEQLDSLKAANEKLIRTHNENTLRISNLQRDNDEYQMKSVTLNSDLHLVKDQMSKRLAELNTRIEELNDENDTLLSKLTELRERSEAQADPVHDPISPPAFEDEDSSSEPTDLDTILQESAEYLAAPAIKNPHSSDLQVETLKANLAHSARTVARLRSALLKQKNSNTPVSTRTPKSSRKSREKDANHPTSSKKSSLVYTPGHRSSRFIILNEDEDKTPAADESWPQEENWEDFIGTDAAINTPSKPTRRVIHDSEDDTQEDPMPETRVSLHRTNSYLQDTDSSESDYEAPNKLSTQRVLSQELSRASEPITEAQVQQFALDNNLVLLTSDDYAKLEYNDINSMNIERITTVAEKKGFVLMSKKDHEDLMTEQEMSRRLEAKGIVTIPNVELEELKNIKTKYQSPDLAYLDEHLKVTGHEMIRSDYLESLKRSEEMVRKPTQAFLRSKCKAANLYPLEKEEYDHLTSLETEHERPSKDYLTTKANEMGLFVSSSEYYLKMENKANNPDEAHVREKALALGLAVLSADEFSKLQSPTLDDIKEKATSKDHVLLSKDEADTLHSLAHEPTIDHIKIKSTQHNHVVLSASEHSALLEPTVDIIREKAKSLGYAVVEDSELLRLQNLVEHPSVDYIKNRIEGHTVLSNDEYDKVHKLAYDPNLSHIQKHAEKHNLVTLASMEYTSLYRQANEPSFEQLSAAAELKNCKLVKESELSRIMSQIEKPDLFHLRCKADEAGYAIVTKEDLSHLEQLAHQPPEGHIREKAENKNMHLLTAGEFESLNLLAHAPDLAHLKEKASSLGHQVTSNDRISALEESASNPSLDQIKSHALSNKHLVVSEVEWNEIQRKAASPTFDELSDKAAKSYNRILVDKEEFQHMKSSAEEPSLGHMENVCEKLGYKIVSLDKIQSLEQCAEAPSKEHLIEKASLLDMTMIPVEYHDSLKQLAHEPELEHLIKHAEAKEHVVIPKAEFLKSEKLAASPDLDHIIKCAMSHGHTVIPKEEFERIKELANSPSFSHIEEKAKAMDYVLVKSVDYERPSLEYLNKCAASLSLVTLSQTEYDHILDQIESPSVEFIKQKATQVGHTLVDDSEFQRLTELANNPSHDWIKDLAQKAGFVMLTFAEHEKLTHELNYPSRNYLNSKAANMNLYILSNEDLSELQRKSESPTISELEEMASKFDLKVLPLKDYQEMTRIIESPSIEEIERVLSPNGYTAISASELLELKALAHDPEVTHIKDVASKKNHAVVPLTEYEELTKLSLNPPLDFVSKMASKHDHVAVNLSDYRQLEEKAISPSIMHLQEHANKHNHMLVNTSEYNDLITFAKEPPMDHVRTVANKLEHVVVPRAEYEEISNLAHEPSLERVKELAKRHSSVTVLDNEFNTLKRLAHEPNLEHLQATASKQEHSIVPTSELDRLRELAYNPPIDHLSLRAAEHDHVVLPQNDFDELNKLAHSPNKKQVQKTAIALGLSAIAVEELKALEKLANTPDISHIKVHGERLGHELIDKEEMLKLRRSIENPSLDSLKKAISSHGFVAVPSSEFQKHIEDKQKIENMKLITNEEYNRLTSISLEPSLDFLKEKAKAKGCMVVDEEQFKELSEKVDSPDHEYLSNKANSLGFVLVAQSEFDDLQGAFEDPTKEFLEEKAFARKLSIIPSKELDALRKLVEEPNLKHITTQAKMLGYTIIAENEHASLKKNTEEPDLVFLETKLSTMAMKPVAIEHIARLEDIEQQFKSPSMDYLRRNVELNDHGVLHVSRISELHDIEKSHMTPSVNYLTQAAEAISYNLISNTRLIELETREKHFLSPELDYLIESSGKYEYKLIKSDEYEQLKSSVQSPTIEHLREKAINLGHVLITSERGVEIEQLENSYNAPSLQYLDKHAKAYNTSLISDEELAGLRAKENHHDSPSVDYLKGQAEVLSLEILTKEEFGHLKEQQQIANAPSKAFIQQHASSCGCVLITESRISELEGLESSYKNPSVEYLETQAGQKDLQLVNKTDYDVWIQKESKSITELAMEVDHIALPNKEYEVLQKSFVEPSLEYIKEKSSAYGCVVLNREDHESFLKQIESPSLDYLTENVQNLKHRIISEADYLEFSESLETKLEKAGLVSLKAPDYMDLVAQLESPSVEFLEEKARATHYCLISQSEFDELSKEANLAAAHKETLEEFQQTSRKLQDLESTIEKPSIDFIKDLAAKQQCMVLPVLQYEDLIKKSEESLHEKATSMSMILLPSSEHEQMKKMLEETLENRAAREGMVVLDSREHENLMSLVNSPTSEYLRIKSKELNMECVRSEELTALREDVSQSLEDRASKSGMVILSTAAFSELHSKAHTPHVSELRLTASSLGYALISTPDLKDLEEKASRTLDDHIKGQNLRIIGGDEYDELLLKANKPSLDLLEQNAQRYGMVLISEEDLATLKSSNEEPLSIKAERSGKIVVDTSEFEKLQNQLQQPSETFLSEKAKAYGLIMIPALEHQNLVASRDKSLEEIGREKGMTLVETEKYDGLITELEAAQNFKLPIIDEKFELLKSALREQGYEVVSKNKYAFLQSNLNSAPQDQLINAARAQGLIVLNSSGESSPSVSEDVANWLEQRGYSVNKDSAEFTDAQESVALNPDELKRSAENMGMVCIDRSTYEDVVKKSKPVDDKDSLLKAAAALSLAVLPLSELTKLKQSLIQKESVLHSMKKDSNNELTETELLQNSRRMNMVLLSKEEYQELKIQAHDRMNIVSEDELRAKAQELGFDVLPISEHNELRKAFELMSEKSLFVEAAKKYHLLCVPEKAFVPTTMARTPDVDKVTLIPTSYYNKLSRQESLNIEKVADDVFRQQAEKRGYVKSLAAVNSPITRSNSEESLNNLSPTTSVGDASPIVVASGETGIPQSKSVQSHLSEHSKRSAIESITGLSIATNISFTDRSMIPAITQVVIGEYLFKYYRKLGPLSSISSSRHERYFWVHPYSLTLYWSTSNPVLTNPSEVRTKAMAIERVESVEDPNPLPPGLHYKSIVIHSKLKSVKITCPTRQRHNIWYNALRYLVNRNIHDLDFGGAKNRPSGDNTSQTALEVEDEDQFDPNVEFEASTRHAFPRSSTISKSRSMNRLPSMRK